jgi:isocitrate/isopropylmalate dehydrogenase
MAVSMMLEYLGEHPSAARIENAVTELLSSGAIPSIDTRSGLSTTQMGEMLVSQVRKP